ncbi:unnamed protein product [Didymodactylos carnosus]|uniref:Uncharacterized protein n=1 Tax=Didymodactylos carnosus TaxID=1234261 RepID=A0A814ZT03_9BILA|nr:unnamed protein product [Didymodactylos carnosus]CAF4014392.1 unnamed protein product [Didymodactylos carnosus]
MCAPQECTYTYSGHNNVVYIVTTIIGLVGGLTKVLQVIIPPIVKFVRKEKRPKEEVAVDPHDIGNQLISTRLFVVCLLAALFILTVYTALIDVTVTHTVTSPSLEQYEKLYKNYPLTLSCPLLQQRFCVAELDQLLKQSWQRGVFLLRLPMDGSSVIPVLERSMSNIKCED